MSVPSVLTTVAVASSLYVVYSTPLAVCDLSSNTSFVCPLALYKFDGHDAISSKSVSKVIIIK